MCSSINKNAQESLCKIDGTFTVLTFSEFLGRFERIKAIEYIILKLNGRIKKNTVALKSKN